MGYSNSENEKNCYRFHDKTECVMKIFVGPLMESLGNKESFVFGDRSIRSSDTKNHLQPKTRWELQWETSSHVPFRRSAEISSDMACPHSIFFLWSWKHKMAQLIREEDESCWFDIDVLAWKCYFFNVWLWYKEGDGSGRWLKRWGCLWFLIMGMRIRDDTCEFWWMWWIVRIITVWQSWWSGGARGNDVR